MATQREVVFTYNNKRVQCYLEYDDVTKRVTGAGAENPDGVDLEFRMKDAVAGTTVAEVLDQTGRRTTAALTGVAFMETFVEDGQTFVRPPRNWQPEFVVRG